MMKRWFLEAIWALGVSIRSGFQLMWGIYRLSRLSHPSVAIFGGKGAYEEGKYAKLAYDLAAHCVQEGMSVITGGGPGIMEAANCGAYETASDKKRCTIGIGVRGVDVGFVNECAPIVNVDYFFARKWLLTRYVCAFILFPGGIGTVNELFEVLDLMKLHKMKRVPVILVGSSYWKDLVAWYEHAHEYEFIIMPHTNVFIVTDDIDEVSRIVKHSC